ncbi:hypothetical protein KSP40_PGU001257 [Platanthera guangdongensis]|uniref:Uncharacterized protein n=1 Tax=Platanthera guangdongensis TaxID=2320717 RepID=A0ABR2M7P1_9ASPA
MVVKQNQGSLCSVLPDNCMLCLLMITTRKLCFMPALCRAPSARILPAKHINLDIPKDLQRTESYRSNLRNKVFKTFNNKISEQCMIKTCCTSLNENLKVKSIVVEQFFVLNLYAK